MNLAELQSKTSEQLLALLNEMEPEREGPPPRTHDALLYGVMQLHDKIRQYSLAHRPAGS